MKVAIVHYWLVGMRGGERVLERMLDLYPQADIFTLVYDPASVSEKIRRRKVTTSFLQKLPLSNTLYQKFLPLMPRALEAFDLSGYDLIISSESGPAKGVIPPPTSAHVCYCHSPMRYIWDHAPQYRDAAGAIGRLGMDLFSTHLRVWDVSTASRVDAFAANSTFVQRRIAKYYGRRATVVHPPVDVGQFSISDEVSDAYLWVGQLTKYKRPDLAIAAFNDLGLPLLVVGQGEMRADLQRRAKDNINFVDNLSYVELKKAYSTAKALIFTAEEDFGIVPVEAMAAGRPVIAYGRGGALDTVVSGVSGLFFEKQEKESLIEAVAGVDKFLRDFVPAECKASMSRFSPENFDRNFVNLVDSALGRELQRW